MRRLLIPAALAILCSCQPSGDQAERIRFATTEMERIRAESHIFSNFVIVTAGGQDFREIEYVDPGATREYARVLLSPSSPTGARLWKMGVRRVVVSNARDSHWSARPSRKGYDVESPDLK